jgi:hypothetical protein
MRLVNDEYCFAAAGQRVEFREIGPIAIHTVKAFDDDPDSSPSAAGAPSRDFIVDGLRIIVARARYVGTPAAYPIMNARVYAFIVHHEVAALGRRRKQGEIGCISAAEIERGSGAKKRSRVFLQCLVLRMIAAQET